MQPEHAGNMEYLRMSLCADPSTRLHGSNGSAPFCSSLLNIF